jgi:hypothetical protein
MCHYKTGSIFYCLCAVLFPKACELKGALTPHCAVISTDNLNMLHMDHDNQSQEVFQALITHYMHLKLLYKIKLHIQNTNLYLPSLFSKLSSNYKMLSTIRLLNIFHMKHINCGFITRSQIHVKKS